MKTGLKAGVVAAALLLLPLAAQAQGTGSGFDWSGPYVGAHGGWLWGDLDYVEPDDPAFAISPQLDGFMGGALAGYNHQIGQLVLGVEVDGALGTVSFDSGDSGGNQYSAFDLDWNVHARARAGLALDNTLLFVAGGLALAGISLDDTDPGFGDDSATHLGWTIGGGLEHVLFENLILRVEYLYDHYGSESYTIDSPPGPFFPAYDADVDLSSHTLRAAVAWRF